MIRNIACVDDLARLVHPDASVAWDRDCAGQDPDEWKCEGMGGPRLYVDPHALRRFWPAGVTARLFVRAMDDRETWYDWHGASRRWTRHQSARTCTENAADEDVRFHLALAV